MLTTDQKAYLKNLANRGEMQAQALLYALAEAETLGEPTVVNLVNVAAKSATSVHGTIYGDAAADAGHAYTTVTTAITPPAVPRNLRCTFGADWDGGDVIITGTDQFGAAATETFTGTADSVQVGLVIFKTVTSIRKAAVGTGTHATNTLTVGTGDKLAIGTAKLLNVFAQCRLDSGAADAVTIDLARNAFTPTTVPDGSVDYSLLVYTDPNYND